MNLGSYSMRPIREDDLEALLEWRNAEPIRARMITDHVIAPEEHRNWYERIRQHDQPLHFIFEHEGRPVGYIGYTDYDTVSGTCSSGLYIGTHEGLPPTSGFAIEFLMLDYAFQRLSVRKLWAGMFAFNRNVIRMHEQFGFRHEGVLKAHILKNENYEDFVLMAIFADDWSERRNRFLRYFR